MSDFLAYLIRLSTTAWTMITEAVTEPEPQYIAYVFVLLACLAAIWFCFHLAARLFTFVFTLLKRGG